jgi:hypothetical protein
MTFEKVIRRLGGFDTHEVPRLTAGGNPSRYTVTTTIGKTPDAPLLDEAGEVVLDADGYPTIIPGGEDITESKQVQHVDTVFVKTSEELLAEMSALGPFKKTTLTAYFVALEGAARTAAVEVPDFGALWSEPSGASWLDRFEATLVDANFTGAYALLGQSPLPLKASRTLLVGALIGMRPTHYEAITKQPMPTLTAEDIDNARGGA